MLEDKLTYNEQFLLKQSLRNACKASYNDLNQSLKEVKSFYKLSDEEVKEYLKTQISDIYDYLKGKGIYGYKEDLECPIYKKPNLDKLKKAQEMTKERMERK